MNSLTCPRKRGHGTRALQHIRIDDRRPDYVFGGLDPDNAFDLDGVRLVSVLSSRGGVDSAGPVYLGTFLFRASDDASGTFTVSLRPGEGTLALDSAGNRMSVQITSDAMLRVGTGWQ